MKRVIKVERKALEEFCVAQATKVKTVLAEDFKDIELINIAAVIMSSIEVMITTDALKTGTTVEMSDAKPQSKIILPKNSLHLKR